MSSSLDSSLPARPTLGAPSVLLLHPDAQRRKLWARFLLGYSLREADSWEAARECFKTSEVHVVVCPWPWAREHLPEQVLNDGVRILYVGGQLPDEVVEDAAAGHRVGFASNEEALPHKLIDLVWPLRVEQHRHQLEDLRVVWAGATGSSHQVVDLSTGGFSFELPSTESIERFVPGSTLNDVRFARHGRICIQGVHVEVRHLSAQGSSYRVGCAFRVDAEAAAAASLHTIQDPVRCLALVRTALRRGALKLVHPEGDTFHLRGGVVDSVRYEFRLNHPLWDIPPFEVVRFTFEVAGVSHTFATTLLEGGDAPVFRAPPLIEARLRRQTERRQVVKPLEIRLEGPLFDQPVFGRVTDLSIAGLGVVVSSRAPVAPGALVDRVRLQLDGRAFVLQAQITHCVRLEGRAGAVRCGLRFRDVSDEEQLAIVRFLMRTHLTPLSDGEQVPFDQLFALFERTHLLSDEYVRQLRPSLPDIDLTFQRLAKQGGTLFKSLVIRHEGQLVGHVSIVRAYQRTFWVQHLAADAGQHRAPYLLNMGAAEMFGQVTEVDFCKVAFFADNKWPARVFGRFARRIDDPRVSVLRGFVPAALSTDPSAHAFGADDGIRVEECDASRLWLVERHFVRTRPDLLLRADDLTKQYLQLGGLSARFAESELDRGRRILLAFEKDRPLAFAVIEHASPGLNLQEHFNSVRVHFLEPVELPRRQALRAALLADAIRFFRGKGLRFARVFLRSKEATEYAALGLQPGQLVLEWTAHRSQFRRFTDHVHRIFEALMARQKARAGRSPKPPPGRQSP